MARERFLQQARLLVRLLPLVADEDVFALKGGTAINLFYRNMPRLSVDIDLTYLPVQGWEASIAGIESALSRIRRRIESRPGVRVHEGGAQGEFRLHVQERGVGVKIEVSPVLRGTVHPPVVKRTTAEVEEQLGFAEVRTVAFEDLYAGKLVAALDRQHPRDLYDVVDLYASEGITEALFKTFLVYVASSNRPPHEILDPIPVDLGVAHETDFQGMTVDQVALGDLLEARRKLVHDVRSRLDPSARTFLLSLLDGDPDFSSIDRPSAARLPAVRWKVQNLDRLRREDPSKHALQRRALESALERGP